VDLEELECKVFRAELTGPFHSEFELSILLHSQSVAFVHLHDTSRSRGSFTKDTFSSQQ
jgi:hypothetical protein